MAADGNLVVDQPPASALAEALVEANDQLLALYELASVTMSSLDGRASAARLLERAGRLLLTDALQLEANGVTVVEGDSPTRRLDADRRSEHGGELVIGVRFLHRGCRGLELCRYARHAHRPSPITTHRHRRSEVADRGGADGFGRPPHLPPSR